MTESYSKAGIVLGLQPFAVDGSRGWKQLFNTRRAVSVSAEAAGGIGVIEIVPNWHPVFAHFSIGLLDLSVVLFLAAALIRQPQLQNQLAAAARWNLWLGALITAGTVLAGLYAFNTVAHDSEAQHLAMIDHRKWAFSTAGLFGVLGLWSLFTARSPLAGIPHSIFLVLIAVAGGMLGVTGYKGGDLVYRHGVGVMPAQMQQAEDHRHGSGPEESPPAEEVIRHEATTVSGETTAHDHAAKDDAPVEHEHHPAEQSQASNIEPAAGNVHAEGHGGMAKHPPAGMTGEVRKTIPAAPRESAEHAGMKMDEHKQSTAQDKPSQHGNHDETGTQAGSGKHEASENHHGQPMEHGGKAMGHHAMHGFYGGYPMSRESSGTAWVPDSSPMEGIHGMYGPWMTMVHGYANLVYDHQGGKRGEDKAFSESMLMMMAMRPFGPGTLGLRGMLSLDPLMGKNGYPLLLQTGETADGQTPLIDRQHPHDFLMELAASYSLPLGKDSSVFGYIGYPGEPALGPPTFMHRFSGMDNPEAPLGHHWLDSTHITFGVATLGYVWRNWKMEASGFNGHEPDENRWNFDKPDINSFSGRISYNPTPNWSLQLSHGHLDSPEQLEPGIDQRRTTASASYNLPFDGNNWQTMLAWGRNDKNPGETTDAVLLETSVRLHDTHTLFGRAEYAEKDELFDAGHPLDGQTFNVGKLSLGYIYDIPLAGNVTLGIGGLGSIYTMPGELEPDYGDHPASGIIFVRLKLN